MITAIHTGLPVIAGQGQGVKIYCSKQAYPVYQQLVAKAGNANYWAGLIVRSIQGLQSGAVNSKDVFVHTGAMHKGLQDFQVIMPGCTVLAQKKNDGSYVISGIDATGDYDKQQEVGERPGLHRVKAKREMWETKFKESRTVEGCGSVNVVGVADRGYGKASDAANRIAPRIKQSGIEQTVSSSGFDLFFTPGNGKLGGLINYQQAVKAETDADLHEAAVILSETMKQAKSLKNVVWFSDMGGSAILTQAMKILATHQHKLEGHKVHFHRARSRKDRAYALSQQLGMTLAEGMGKSNLLNVNELIGGTSLSVPFQRFKHESDYTLLKGASDVVKGIKDAKSAWGTVSALGAAAAFSGSFPAAATVIGVIGSALTIASANAPDATDRLMSKF
ncbi:hypothetical protein [Parendozoicomonas sp. Alg238-R29]|uniref:hypothetical protein n=1 Tax=Parendozoicomonas sp. Alg238-R29 TaxID=2993446 RepID=UPI00248D9AE2|nr:hypothetical protein [Parendozoicomonas sp. Alg238-R29]